MFAKSGYHASDSNEFVGLRTTAHGRRQVVYDALSGRRIIVNIESQSVSEYEIHAALQEGISARNVLNGVFVALKARNIDFGVAC